jgi:succinate-acetate transporter protein
MCQQGAPLDANLNDKPEKRVLMDRTANPAPLGLLGFGMTTVMLNLHNADLMPLGSVVLSLGIFYGGLGQLLVGMLEWKKGNTFGTAAFTSYGLFWLTLVGIWTLPTLGLGEPTDKATMGCFLAIWGVFTLFFLLGTLKSNRATQFVFGSLTVLFFGLALGDLTQIEEVTVASGYIGLVCGASAIYTGLAMVVNEANGRAMLPLGDR